MDENEDAASVTGYCLERYESNGEAVLCAGDQGHAAMCWARTISIELRCEAS